MKLQISENAAASLAALAVIARIASGVLIDMPDLLNAGWLAVLLGAALAFPLMFALSRIRAAEKGSKRSIPRPLCPVFFIIAIWDAAAVASMIADSAGYLALDSIAPFYLMLPQFALCFACLLMNGDALGGSAAIWNKLLPALLLIVILLQSENFQPQWLTPVLGPGLPAILNSALRIAGWFSLPAGLFLIAEPEKDNRSGRLEPLKMLAVSAVFASLIAIVFSMITPLVPDRNLSSRTFRFEALLTNGRNGLALQLPMIALWYPCLFYALLFDVFTGAAMLQKFLPNWARDACIWLSLICTALFAASHYSNRSAVIPVSGWLFAALSTATLLYMLHILKLKGEKHSA